MPGTTFLSTARSIPDRFNHENAWSQTFPLETSVAHPASMATESAPSEVPSEARASATGRRCDRCDPIGPVNWKHLGLAALVSYALGICAFLLWFALTRPIPRGPKGPKVLKDSEYPPKYGKIPEKTIWFYYNKGWDPMPNRLVELCVQTFCVTWIRWRSCFRAISIKTTFWRCCPVISVPIYATFTYAWLWLILHIYIYICVYVHISR